MDNDEYRARIARREAVKAAIVSMNAEALASVLGSESQLLSEGFVDQLSEEVRNWVFSVCFATYKTPNWSFRMGVSRAKNRY